MCLHLTQVLVKPGEGIDSALRRFKKAVMNSVAVSELPLNTRDTYQLLQLQPGVQSQLGSNLFAGSSDPGVVSVNGGRGRANNYPGGNGPDRYPPIIVERAPVGVQARPVLVASPPVYAQPQPVVMTAPAAPAPVAASAPCTCLTKQYQNDGSVVFRYLCTREAAVATAAHLQAQAQSTAQPQATAR